jgi:hypothetical protein
VAKTEGERWETVHDGVGEILHLWKQGTTALVEMKMDSGATLIFSESALWRKAVDPAETVPGPDRGKVRYAANRIAQERAKSKGVDYTGPSGQDYYDVLCVMGAFTEYEQIGLD